MSRFHAVKKGMFDRFRFETMVFPDYEGPAAVLKMSMSLSQAKRWGKKQLKQYPDGWIRITCYKWNGLTSYWEWHRSLRWTFSTQEAFLCVDCGDVYASGFYDPTQLCKRHKP